MPTIRKTPRTWVVYSGRDDLEASLAAIAADGGGPVRWFVTDPTSADESVAARHGLRAERDLLQVRRPLPLEVPVPSLSIRTFVPGQDESEWVDVNNRAFDTHPEQGGWSIDDVLAREKEAWFDPEGFLLHHDEDTGALAAFVWTKIHHDEAPPSGEIYVIGVDPAFQGRGLGRAMTIVGLDWLHRARGITRGMLYVDRTNSPAIAMYDKLGFMTDHVDRSFIGTI